MTKLTEIEARAAKATPRRERPRRPNLNAYYYSFDATGNPHVDEILSAVAAAGKAAHHTEDWSDNDCYGMGSPIEWIQEAANEAAEAFKDIPALCATVRAQDKHIEELEALVREAQSWVFEGTRWTERALAALATRPALPVEVDGE